MPLMWRLNKIETRIDTELQQMENRESDSNQIYNHQTRQKRIGQKYRNTITITCQYQCFANRSAINSKSDNVKSKKKNPNLKK